MRKLLFNLFLISSPAFSHDLPDCESLSYSTFPLEYAREIKIALHPNVARISFPSLEQKVYLSRVSEKSCAQALMPIHWKRFGLYSTNEASAFSMLESQHLIGGFAGKHWLGQSLRAESIDELGVQPTLESLLAAGIDAIFRGPYQWQDTEDRFERLGIQSLPLMDVKETHPLARVEWLYYFGLVLSRFDQALALVSKIKSEISHLTQSPPIASKRFLLGHFYHGQWFTPGDDHELVQLIKTAGGESVFSELKGRGPYSISFEEVMKRRGQIDLWLPQASWNNLEEGLLIEGRHSFLHREGGPDIFLFKKEQWSIPFYESGVLRPDLVIQDLKAMMTGNNPQHYFKPRE